MAKFDQLESAVKSLDKEVKILTADMQKLINLVNENSKSQAELAAKTNQVKKASEQITDTEKERIRLQKQLNKAMDEGAIENADLKLQVQELNKANKDAAREKRGLIGAYEKESKQLIKLRKQYKDLAAGGKTNTKQAKNLRKEITRLDGKLKGIDKTVGQHQRNVGNYGNALQALPGGIGAVVSSIKMLSKALLATPLGWIIALLAVAAKAVQSFFTSSEEGQDRWNMTMTKAKVVLGNFSDEISKVGKKIVEFNDNVLKSEDGLKNWAKNVGQNVRQKWNQFRDDVEDQGFWATVKNSATDAYDTIIGKVQELQEENARELKIAENLANRQNALNKQERSALVETAKLRRDIAEFRAQAADKEGTSAQERINLIEKAIEAENEILRVNEAIAAEKLQLKIIENSLSNSTREDLMEEAQLRKTLIDLQTTNAERRRRFTAEQQTAIRELQAEEQKFWNEFIGNQDEIFAEIEKQVDAEVKAVEESLKKQQELRTIAGEEELERFKEIEEAKQEIRNASLEAGGEIASQLFTARIDDETTKFKDSQKAQEDILKDRLDKGTIDEDQYEKELKKIRLKGRQEEAKAEKKKALFDIAIATAVAVAKSIPNPVLIGLSLALGAVQAAVVASKPIPKFKTGTKGKLNEGTFAVVGDGFEHELITTPDGSFLSDNKPQTVWLPKSSEVFSGADTKELMQENRSNILNLDPLIKEQRATRAAIMSKNNAPVWTEKGLSIRDAKKSQRVTYINKYIRGI
jgi:hypothetical protein